MGWKDKAQKKLELGSIPHAGVISDERARLLEEKEPKDMNIKKRIFESVSKYQEKQHDEISTDANMNDISIWLDELQTNGVIIQDPNIVELEIPMAINPFICADGRFSLDDVMNVLYKKVLTPTQFYFCINASDESNVGYIVYFVSIIYWEHYKQLDDRNIEDVLVPGDVLKKIRSSVYEAVDVSLTPSEMRRELIRLGFRENGEIILV